jgi:hypothetical protein
MLLHVALLNLQSQIQVFKEMNKMFQMDIVGTVREKWEKTIPVLLSLAKKKKTPNILKLLASSSYGSQLDSSLGTFYCDMLLIRLFFTFFRIIFASKNSKVLLH